MDCIVRVAKSWTRLSDFHSLTRKKRVHDVGRGGGPSWVFKLDSNGAGISTPLRDLEFNKS